MCIQNAFRFTIQNVSRIQLICCKKRRDFMKNTWKILPNFIKMKLRSLKYIRKIPAMPQLCGRNFKEAKKMYWECTNGNFYWATNLGLLSKLLHQGNEWLQEGPWMSGNKRLVNTVRPKAWKMTVFRSQNRFLFHFSLYFCATLDWYYDYS